MERNQGLVQQTRPESSFNPSAHILHCVFQTPDASCLPWPIPSQPPQPPLAPQIERGHKKNSECSRNADDGRTRNKQNPHGSAAFRKTKTRPRFQSVPPTFLMVS